MRTNQWKNSETTKNLNIVTPPKDCTSPQTIVPNQNGNLKMTLKNQTWIARKLNKIQNKIENQEEETYKAIKKIKEEINILNYCQSELLELKNSLKKFQNAIERFISRLDQAKQRISDFVNQCFKPTHSDRNNKYRI